MKINKIKNQIGATAIEYGLIAGLIAVALLTVFSLVGGNLSNVYCNVSFGLGEKSCNGTTNPADLSLADKLQSSMTDKLDLSYLDASQGGTAVPYSGNHWFPSTTGNGYFRDEAFTNMTNALESLNSKDPITNVFGLFDTSNGKPVNDYNSVLNYFHTTQTGLTGVTGKSTSGGCCLYGQGLDSSGQLGEVEVTTQSGKVYTISPFGTKQQPSK